MTGLTVKHRTINIYKITQEKSYGSDFSDKTPKTALAGVAQWIECGPANQGGAGLIPSQGTCLDRGPGPQLGACEGQPHIDVSLPLFLLPFPLKNK